MGRRINVLTFCSKVLSVGNKSCKKLRVFGMSCPYSTTRTLPDFPSNYGRYGMVGSYIGKETVIFCGGTENFIEKVQKDCFRYQFMMLLVFF